MSSRTSAKNKSFRWGIWRSEFWFMLTEEHVLAKITISSYSFKAYIHKSVRENQPQKYHKKIIKENNDYVTILLIELTRTFSHDIRFQINNWITFCIYEINTKVCCYLTTSHYVLGECYVSSYRCILHMWSLLHKWKSNLALGEYQILPTPDGKNKTEKSIYVHTTKYPQPREGIDPAVRCEYSLEQLGHWWPRDVLPL
jgi:hypothetical protein